VAVATALFDTRCRPALPRQLAYKHARMLRAELCIFVSCASSVWHTKMGGASSAAAAATGSGPLSPRAIDIVQGTEKKRMGPVLHGALPASTLVHVQGRLLSRARHASGCCITILSHAFMCMACTVAAGCLMNGLSLGCGCLVKCIVKDDRWACPCLPPKIDPRHCN
jgi:hypothetical protein